MWGNHPFSQKQGNQKDSDGGGWRLEVVLDKI